ncbi:MAG: hypothetical protein JXA90_14350 [Planctomycetes bacterium]|nr:hypothetical protein [Planctomycetota bacterium]
MRPLYWLAASLLALPIAAGAEAETAKKEKLKSGLQPDEGVPAFQVVDVTGRFKEQPAVCYI